MNQEKSTLDHNLVNKPCPFCGDLPDLLDPDFSHPLDQCYTIWQACCLNMECSATVYGATKREAIDNWNKRYDRTD